MKKQCLWKLWYKRMGQPDKTTGIISIEVRTVNPCSLEDKHIPWMTSG